MPTLNVSMPKDMIDFVEGEVRNGGYVSNSEVIREAIRILKRDREIASTTLALLRKEIDHGFEQSERGEFSSRSVEDIFHSVINGNEP